MKFQCPSVPYAVPTPYPMAQRVDVETVSRLCRLSRRCHAPLPRPYHSPCVCAGAIGLRGAAGLVEEAERQRRADPKAGVRLPHLRPALRARQTLSQAQTYVSVCMCRVLRGLCGEGVLCFRSPVPHSLHYSDDSTHDLCLIVKVSKGVLRCMSAPAAGVCVCVCVRNSLCVCVCACV